ncbi:hypothetical protein N9917_00175 [Deltaproteobacteria bacterium]|nr:hypothetical protein [Deltaproteobacteria bacterium]
MRGTDRLIGFLRENPAALTEVLTGLDISPCEGFQGPCEGRVLESTPSQTRYEWDGKGLDPNAKRLLCPPCSKGYTEEMNAQWAEYHAGLL